jgi:hypothetical protein
MSVDYVNKLKYLDNTEIFKLGNNIVILPCEDHSDGSLDSRPVVPLPTGSCHLFWKYATFYFLKLRWSFYIIVIK